uniref:Cyclic nucleotide-binding domain-containing protein n=1 Tax=mine drainage metagenome TaxID=410659 RepID=E6QI64_9ZZZZ
MKLNGPSFVADADFVKALEARARPFCCAKTETLFRQGDSPDRLYILEKGRTTLTVHTRTGDQKFGEQTLPGSVLGLPGVIGNVPYSLTATAEKGSELRVISKDEFHALLQSQPALTFHALKMLAAEVHSARRSVNKR